jgi:hypothetical protein
MYSRFICEVYFGEEIEDLHRYVSTKLPIMFNLLRMLGGHKAIRIPLFLWNVIIQCDWM